MEIFTKYSKNDNIMYGIFGEFSENFENINSTKIGVITQEEYLGVRVLIDYIDDRFFSDEKLINYFENFIENISFDSITHVKFENYNEKDDVEIIIKELMRCSEEIINQNETVAIELPTSQEKAFDLETNFLKTFISTNRENKKILFLTNNKSLIELYEKI
jgi:hypothetical protein